MDSILDPKSAQIFDKFRPEICQNLIQILTQISTRNLSKFGPDFGPILDPVLASNLDPVLSSEFDPEFESRNRPKPYSLGLGFGPARIGPKPLVPKTWVLGTKESRKNRKNVKI